MTKRDKRLQKLRQNPKQVSFDEIKQILEDYGFIEVRTQGSHHTFIAELGKQNWRITIPFRRPVKLPYIREALKQIDEIRQLKDQEEEDEDDGSDAS
jgi:predicted RNA binding protein YcfA (HicA-like mRNA interferase family)